MFHHSLQYEETACLHYPIKEGCQTERLKAKDHAAVAIDAAAAVFAVVVVAAAVFAVAAFFFFPVVNILPKK